MKEFDTVVAGRRSVRKYNPDRKITREEIEILVAAAQEAPSWANTQTPRYYAVLDPDKLAALKDMIGAYNKKNTADAPALIVTTFEKGKAGFYKGESSNEVGDGWGAYDSGVSNAYFILKACEQGLDTLIMGIRDAEAIRTLLDIPESEQVMTVIALGCRSSEAQRPVRKELSEILKVF